MFTGVIFYNRNNKTKTKKIIPKGVFKKPNDYRLECKTTRGRQNTES